METGAVIEIPLKTERVDPVENETTEHRDNNALENYKRKLYFFYVFRLT